jgi:hypothetical protein
MQIEETDSAALQAVLVKDGEAIEQIEEHLKSLPKAELTRCESGIVKGALESFAKRLAGNLRRPESFLRAQLLILVFP